MQMFLPLSGKLNELFFRFVLESLFDFVDFRDNGSETLNFALVFVADDFLEDPLDHNMSFLSLRVFRLKR